RLDGFPAQAQEPEFDVIGAVELRLQPPDEVRAGFRGLADAQPPAEHRRPHCDHAPVSTSRINFRNDPPDYSATLPVRLAPEVEFVSLTRAFVTFSEYGNMVENHRRHRRHRPHRRCRLISFFALVFGS